MFTWHNVLPTQFRCALLTRIPFGSDIAQIFQAFELELPLCFGMIREIVLRIEKPEPHITLRQRSLAPCSAKMIVFNQTATIRCLARRESPRLSVESPMMVMSI